MFAIARFRYIKVFSIYFTVTGLKKIARYAEDFVTQKFVKSTFH